MDKNTPPEDDVLESDKQCILLRSFWRQFLSWKSWRLPLCTVTVVMLAQFDPTAAPSLGGRLPFLFPVSCVAGGFVEGGGGGGCWERGRGNGERRNVHVRSCGAHLRARQTKPPATLATIRWSFQLKLLSAIFPLSCVALWFFCFVIVTKVLKRVY